MNLPIYKAQITDVETGMYTVSLVDCPAVQSDFLYFKDEREPMTFKVQDEEQRIVTGVLMRADYPIYRIGPSGYEYYIVFDRETIEMMAEKWLAEGLVNNVNLMHDSERYVDGVYLKEVYFKDLQRGIDPKGYEDISEGSLFASYKVMNDEVWESIKNGTFKGFSIECVMDTVKVEDEMERDLEEILAMLEKLTKSK